jgi:hypothetical protein
MSTRKRFNSRGAAHEGNHGRALPGSSRTDRTERAITRHRLSRLVGKEMTPTPAEVYDDQKPQDNGLYQPIIAVCVHLQAPMMPYLNFRPVGPY